MIFEHLESCLIHQCDGGPTQSGRSVSWVLESDKPQRGYLNPVTGLRASCDVLAQTRILFPDLESAVRYAKENRMRYSIKHLNPRQHVKKSYQNNFIARKTFGDI